MPEEQKAGRPKLPPEKCRSVRIGIRLTPAEFRALTRLAEQESRSRADLLVIRTLGRRF